jgi:phosphoribosylformylglycinamidine synthase
LPGALLRNVGTRFICKNVGIAPASNKFPLSRPSYSIPIAHADGRFYCPPDELKRLEDNEQIVFRYLDNPNGSVGDVAGICDETGRIVAMMPHPERAADPALRNTDGVEILHALLS